MTSTVIYYILCCKSIFLKHDCLDIQCGYFVNSLRILPTQKYRNYSIIISVEYKVHIHFYNNSIIPTQCVLTFVTNNNDYNVVFIVFFYFIELYLDLNCILYFFTMHYYCPYVNKKNLIIFFIFIVIA